MSKVEATARLAKDGPNRLPAAMPRRAHQQLLSVLREPMLILLLAAGLISYTLGEPLEATFLLLSVLFVIAISFYQTRKTDKALDALRVLIAPRAQVMRDGVIQKISSEDVVNGDLILLTEGDRVPADAQLTQVANLSIDESTMTGEAFSIDKQVGHKVLSGTLVVRGHGEALVTASGTQTEIGKMGKSLFRPSNKRTNLQEEIDRLVIRIATLSILSAVAVTITFGLTRGRWLEGSLAGIAAVMSLLPEELPIILTVFFGLGAWRMSRLGVVVRSNPAIEMLGQVSVLCVDKTGTITKNEMTLVKQNPDVAFYGLLASPQNPFDPMDRAFHLAATLDDNWHLLREYPVTEEQLAICHVWETPKGSLQYAAKGAPETIAKFCGYTDEELADLLREVDEVAQGGFRVLAVAALEVSSGLELPVDPSSLPFQFIGLALLSDPVRPGVADAVRTMSQAGVRTIMITGDYSVTATAIASEIGLLNPSQVLTGPDMEKLSDEALRDHIDRVNVFSRMLPSQKLRLVEALRSKSNIVAMTGDGVNDAPALKSANVGIAMGSRGSEVAREAADIVITDDSFISITNGISEGRRIYSNLRRASSYIIAIHVPIFGLAILPVLSPYWPLVLLPAQIALLELIIDPASSLAYENEKQSASDMQNPPRKSGDHMINKSLVFVSLMQGFFLLIGAGGVYLWALANGLSQGQTRAISFATLLLGNLFLMLANRSLSVSLVEILLRRTNAQAYVIFVAGISILIILFAVTPIRTALRFESLEFTYWLLAFCASSLSIVWLESYKAFKKIRKSRVKNSGA